MRTGLPGLPLPRRTGARSSSPFPCIALNSRPTVLSTVNGVAGTLAAMRPDRDAILKALENVIDPELRRPVTELDMVRDVLVEDDGSVSVTIALTVAGCPLRDSFSGAGLALRRRGARRHARPPRLRRHDVRRRRPRSFRGCAAGTRQTARSRCRRGRESSPSRRGRVASASRPSPPTSPTRSRSSASRSACSTATSTGTRSRTCSASTRSRSPSTR